MRAAIYLRVSTKDKGQDVDNQRLQLEKYAEENNWTIVKIYTDKKSGKTDQREAFQAMFADAAEKKFDVLLFWSIDRFTREGTFGTLKHLEKLNSMQIKFLSYTEKYIDSCGMFKDVVISLLSTLAKQERIRISERTLAGLERSKKRGEAGPKGYVGGGRPRKPFDLKAAIQMREDDYSMRDIATALNVSKATVINRLREHGL